MTEQTLRPIGGVAPKLHDHHLRRQAIVYVRQSHPQQVLDHVESIARQYGLVDRAAAWGWARDRIVVIDGSRTFYLRIIFRDLSRSACVVPISRLSALETRFQPFF